MTNGNDVTHISGNAGSPTRGSRFKRSSNIIILAYPFVAAILSSIVCYHLGKMSTAGGESSPWDASISQPEGGESPHYMQNNKDIVDTPYTGAHPAQHNATSVVNDDDPKSDRRFVPRDNLPYNCGKSQKDTVNQEKLRCQFDSAVITICSTPQN